MHAYQENPSGKYVYMDSKNYTSVMATFSPQPLQQSNRSDCQHLSALKWEMRKNMYIIKYTNNYTFKVFRFKSWQGCYICDSGASDKHIQKDSLLHKVHSYTKWKCILVFKSQNHCNFLYMIQQSSSFVSKQIYIAFRSDNTTIHLSTIRVCLSCGA